MGFVRITAFLVGIASLLSSINTMAAEFSLFSRSGGMEISGEIKTGDYARLLDFLRSSTKNQSHFLNNVVLDSPGGNVIEAMKIANLMEKNYAQVFVLDGARCFSSCFILWASASVRTIIKSGKLGVHRITLSQYGGNLSKAERSLAPVSQGVESYLLKVGIPRRIVDKMNETSSADLFVFDLPWLVNENLYDAMSYRPSLIDMAQKKCGRDPFAEAGRKGLRPDQLDRDSVMQWLQCVESVREENQNSRTREFQAMLRAP